jgi:hypothetical protein
VGSKASVSTEASLRDHQHRVAALTVHLHKKRDEIEVKKSPLRQWNPPLPRARVDGGAGSEVSVSFKEIELLYLLISE